MKLVRALALTFAALLLHAVPTLAEQPADVAHRFLQAFEKKDYATIRGLFAPGASVTTAELSRSEPAKQSHKPADEWAAQSEKEMAAVTFEKLEVLETSTVAFDQGATVAVHFRSRGKAGEFAFVNEGIDTYSLIQVDGAWRILRYGTFERLEAR